MRGVNKFMRFQFLKTTLYGIEGYNRDTEKEKRKQK